LPISLGPNRKRKQTRKERERGGKNHFLEGKGTETNSRPHCRRKANGELDLMEENISTLSTLQDTTS
jgi:hypothetical protein